MSVAQVVEDFVRQNPGCSKAQIRRAVNKAMPLGIRFIDDNAINALERRSREIETALQSGLYVNKGRKNHNAWHLTPAEAT